MPSANGNGNSANSGHGPPNIPRGQLPDAIASTFDIHIASIQALIVTLTAQQLSASQYVTAVQAQIDALNTQLIALQGSVTP
jgi:hypothetical protein